MSPQYRASAVVIMMMTVTTVKRTNEEYLNPQIFSSVLKSRKIEKYILIIAQLQNSMIRNDGEKFGLLTVGTHKLVLAVFLLFEQSLG